MANKLRGEMPLSLGDKEFTLSPTMAAIADIEDAFGGLPDICTRLREGQWKVTEIVGITAILLRSEKLGRAALQESIMDASPAAVATAIHLCLLSAFTGVTIEELTGESDAPEGNAEAAETTH